MIFEAIAYGVAVPVFAVAIVMLVGNPRAHRATPLDPYLAGAALSGAYLVGHWALEGGLELAPTEVIDWMPHLALAAFLWFCMAHRIKDSRRLAVVDLVVGLLAAYLLLHPVLLHAESLERGATLGLAAGALAVFAVLIERSVETEHPVASAALLAVYAIAAAAIAAASGTFRVAQLLGLVAAALGSVSVGAAVFARPLQVASLGRVTAMLLWGGILLTEFYAELASLSLILLAIAPIAASITSFGLRRSGPRVRFFSVLAVVLVLVGAAGWQSTSVGTASSSTGAAAPHYGYD